MKRFSKLVLASVGFMSVSCFSLASCSTNIARYVEVDGVAFETKSYTMEVGGEFQLNLVFNPVNATNKKVTYLVTASRTTASDFISVSPSGLVTAKSKGTGTVTVVTDEAFYKDVCSIEVKDKIYKVTSILLPATETVKQGKSISLTPEILPSNATNKNVTWSSSNTSIATVTSGGAVTGVNQGSATITARSVDSSELTATCVVTVTEPVRVSGLTLSSSSLTLKQGKTATLTATVSPSDAYDKSITWTSSNSSAVSVDSKGIVTAITAGGSATITATTNDGGYTATCSVSVEDKEPADAWTVMLYICGADLESKNGLATSDLKEILSVGGQPDDVNIVIQTGGASSWKTTYGISKTYLERYHVKNKSLVRDKQLTYASMGLSSTLQSFIEYGLTEYPADKTALIFWNHGGGMRGVCYDEKKNDDVLKNSEIQTALKNAFSNCGLTGQKLEWVGYDACLMQVQDIAETNSKYFNYMIASEESESGYGWDYDTWIDDLYAEESTETILKAIVDGFIKDNGGASSTNSDQTLSYLDLSYAAEYKTAWEDMAAQLNNKVTSSNKSSFNSAITKNVKHYADSDYDYFCTFDAWDFVNQLESSNSFSNYRIDSSYTTAVKNAHANLVKYNLAQKGAGVSKGLAMYWPNSSSYSDVDEYYTTSETNFTTWRSFCVNKGYHS